MLFNELLPIAERVVGSTRKRLPEEIRNLAAALPVVYHDHPSDAILGEEFEPDILGLFVGDHHGIDSGSSNGVPPQIILFLDNIYEQAEGDLHVFREEVRDTYLHELGHYLGWDEQDLEDRGL